MTEHRARWFLLIVLAAMRPAMADVKLPGIFGDNMVLQRGERTAVWGMAAPGEEVTVAIGGGGASVRAGADGRWKASVKPPATEGPHELQVSGTNTLTFKNVLVGEVWLASGQSNMVWPVRSSDNSEQEIAAADFPQIRFFTFAQAPAEEPAEDVKGSWIVCSPQSVGMTSAVAYYFARQIHQDLKAPVGIMVSAVGSTRAEVWTSKEGMDQAGPTYTQQWKDWRADIATYETKKKQYELDAPAWDAKVPHLEPENAGEAQGWARPDFDASAWKTMELPATWESRGLHMDGVVWFRKEIDLPPEWAGKGLQWVHAAVDDWDTSYFDGQVVGSTHNDPQKAGKPRVYYVPAKLVSPGKHVLAVRVFDRFGTGGLVGHDKAMIIRPQSDKGRGIALYGTWQYQIEKELPEIPDEVLQTQPVPPVRTTFQSPTSLFNGMIHPLIPFTIRGVIWYQGEHNTDTPVEYRTILPAMIRDWRSRWGAELPFIQVQLANLGQPPAEPQESSWAQLRESQEVTMLTVPKVGLATAIDIGDAASAHPKNKQEVGRRLALWAMALAYGKNIEPSGPIYKSMTIEGDKARIAFTHLGGGLVVKGDKLAGFTIAGADMKFVWADAAIDGDTLLVHSDKVAQPAAVRYGWAGNPVTTLYNKAGLPALPFRTDGR